MRTRRQQSGDVGRRWLLGVVVMAGCTTPGLARPRSLVDAHYLLSPRPASSPQTATAVYRSILAKSMGSHCRMLPTDSEFFDRKVAQCGAVPGVMAGFSRMLLEIEATPEVVEPVPATDRVHWLDLPRDDSCWR